MPTYQCTEITKGTHAVEDKSPRCAARKFVAQAYWPDGWCDAEIWVEDGQRVRKFLIDIERDG